VRKRGSNIETAGKFTVSAGFPKEKGSKWKSATLNKGKNGEEVGVMTRPVERKKKSL